MTRKTAHKIYTVLVSEAGAFEGDRGQFVDYCMSRSIVREWRFCGLLGFGGKFYLNCEEYRISCYPEDSTRKRRAIIKKVNAQLKKIWDSEHL